MAADKARRRPLDPLLVLAVAVLLPGMGQVLNGMLLRAWVMLRRAGCARETSHCTIAWVTCM